MPLKNLKQATVIYFVLSLWFLSLLPNFVIQILAVDMLIYLCI